ncbi:MAG: zinc-finger domain-containing protein [Alphaproteobacteria bacterium GM7ARS4]|nr:zinc-finger domain-containing protein [Alphaproteobacteria bacterium GM7ARS4]
MVESDRREQGTHVSSHGEDSEHIEEVVYVESSVSSVCCCGEGVRDGGHPRVYLPIGEKGYVICPYCHRRFVRRYEG